MNKIVLAVSCLLCLLATGFSAPAGEESTVTFDDANRLYEEGRFLEAIDGYRALLTNGPTLALHFNLGNAYFKSGRIGDAIVEYRLAERLAPRDPDVQANLKFARARVEGPRLPRGWIQERMHTLTAAEWTAVATGSIWTFFTLLIARQLVPGWRKPLRSWTILAGSLATILLAFAIWAERSRANERVAVVTERDAVMRFGPFEESQSALDLRNGAELSVLDRKDDWLQVTPNNGQVGWLPADSVRILEP